MERSARSLNTFLNPQARRDQFPATTTRNVGPQRINLGADGAVVPLDGVEPGGDETASSRPRLHGSFDSSVEPAGKDWPLGVLETSESHFMAIVRAKGFRTCSMTCWSSMLSQICWSCLSVSMNVFSAARLPYCRAVTYTLICSSGYSPMRTW
jgi:hypothetical protein